jgi:hypothetical protein
MLQTLLMRASLPPLASVSCYGQCPSWASWDLLDREFAPPGSRGVNRNRPPHHKGTLSAPSEITIGPYSWAVIQLHGQTRPR